MRIALCQINPTIGDFDGNVAKILRDAERAKAGGAQLAIFSELVISGYSPADLLEREAFLAAAERALGKLTQAAPLPLLVGAFARVSNGSRPIANVAILVTSGRSAIVAQKRLLPTYDVFDEDRYFEPGRVGGIIDIEGRKLGITTCEDAWNDVADSVVTRRYLANPVEDVVRAGADVIVNLAASPFTLAKRIARARMLSASAKKHGKPLLFVNQVGGQDDLIFDGSSTHFDGQGVVRARARAFAEDVVITDLDGGGEIREAPESDERAALDALVLGTRDYAKKCGIKRAVLGLSGGIDSALTAVIATEALGKENVLGVALPTRYSSPSSVVDAEALAKTLGIDFRTVPIDRIFQSYLDDLGPVVDSISAASPSDVTFENVQARIRCAILMGIANRSGAMLLTTGNKSEVAVGYCTLYGDMGGGLAVISDLYKTLVYRVAHEVNAKGEIIPRSTMEKAPSAELRPNQKDEDSLPPYDVLDAILIRLIELRASAADVIAQGFDEATVKRVEWLVRTSEHKRRQLPPGLIVTGKAFGPGRRIPIARAAD